MTFVQVQYRRKLAGSPAIGKWNIYSSAWFSTANVVPGSAVQLGLQRLFHGVKYDGTGNVVSGFTCFDISAGSALLTTHEWDVDHKVKLADYVVTVPNISAAGQTYLPHQCAIAVGYRSTVGVNTRAGRSRFYIGPLEPSSNYVTGTTAGGLRLNATGLTSLRDNFVACVGSLTAAGWTLQVSSGRPARTFAAAKECYIDDVLDVQRSRRPWQLDQRRGNL